jgi:hypothetical protein
MAKEPTQAPKTTKEELENLEEDDEFEEFEAVGMNESIIMCRNEVFIIYFQ